VRTCGCTPYATSKVTPLYTPLRRRPPFFTASHHVGLLIPGETPPSYHLKTSRSTLRRLPLPLITYKHLPTTCTHHLNYVRARYDDSTPHFSYVWARYDNTQFY